MSAKKYTTTSTNRLIDLINMKVEDFEAFLANSPQWMQDVLISSLSRLTHP